MKCQLLIVSMFLIAFSVAVSLADLRDGLVAYWPLDGNAEDIIGGNHGEVMGEPDWSSGGDAFLGQHCLQA